MGISLQVFGHKPIQYLSIGQTGDTREKVKGTPKSLRPWELELNFVQSHLINFEIFRWINENFDQLVAPEEKSGDHQSHWLRFISSSTSPHSLPLSPWYYVTAYVAGRPLGEHRERRTHLLLCTFSPNYHGSTASFRLSATLLFTNHQKYLQAHFRTIIAKSVWYLAKQQFFHAFTDNVRNKEVKYQAINEIFLQNYLLTGRVNLYTCKPTYTDL